MKRFHSIEYVDDEGDHVIRHAMMTSEEVQQLLEECAARGVSVTIHDLTPEPVEAAVFFEDEESPRLEAAPRGSFE